MNLTPRNALLALPVLFVLFLAVTGLALLLGSPDLGSAMTFGVMAFVAAVAALILRAR